jgi:uncharacterized protein (DUF362 family)
MEGNGPTGGTPREIGAVLMSESPFVLDAAAEDAAENTADSGADAV